MTTITQRLTHLTMLAAVLAAGFVAQVSHAAPPEARVVQLPRVIVTGHRIQVVQLERVVVTAKRVTPAAMLVAQRGAAKPA